MPYKVNLEKGRITIDFPDFAAPRTLPFGGVATSLPPAAGNSPLSNLPLVVSTTTPPSSITGNSRRLLSGASSRR